MKRENAISGFESTGISVRLFHFINPIIPSGIIRLYIPKHT